MECCDLQRPQLSLDINLNPKIMKRPNSLPFGSEFFQASGSGKDRVVGPAFSTLMSPGGRKLDVVPLPVRYKRYFEKDAEKDKSSDQAPSPIVSEELSDREKDLDGAIQWIKQEIMLLKQQDRLLMRKLLDLRATIHQIRGARLFYNYDVDLNSSDESWISLNSDGCLSAPCIDSPLSESGVLSAFHNATRNMMSVPNSPAGGFVPKFPKYNIHGQQLGKSLDFNLYVKN